MKNAISWGLFLALLSCLLLPALSASYPIDVINSRHYAGDYFASQ